MAKAAAIVFACAMVTMSAASSATGQNDRDNRLPLKAVVPIVHPIIGSNYKKWTVNATGFIYKYAGPGSVPDEYYLVTAGHVAKVQETRPVDEEHAQEFIFNASNGNDSDRGFSMGWSSKVLPSGLWCIDPKEDIAVTPLIVEAERLNGYDHDFFDGGATPKTPRELQDIGVQAGDDIRVVGFPIYMHTYLKSYPTVMAGIIASIQEFYDADKLKRYAESDANNDHIILNFSNIGGNSGAPAVLLKHPSSDHPGADRQILLGVVINVRQQMAAALDESGKPIARYVQLSGLAEIVPMLDVDALIAASKARSDACIKRS